MSSGTSTQTSRPITVIWRSSCKSLPLIPHLVWPEPHFSRMAMTQHETVSKARTTLPVVVSFSGEDVFRMLVVTSRILLAGFTGLWFPRRGRDCRQLDALLNNAFIFMH